MESAQLVEKQVGRSLFVCSTKFWINPVIITQTANVRRRQERQRSINALTSTFQQYIRKGVAAQPNAIAALADRRFGCVACGWRTYHEAQPIHISACQGLGDREDERSTQMP